MMILKSDPGLVILLLLLLATAFNAATATTAASVHKNDLPKDCWLQVAGEYRDSTNTPLCWTAAWSTTRQSTLPNYLRYTVSLVLKPTHWKFKDPLSDFNDTAFRWSKNVSVV